MVNRSQKPPRRKLISSKKSVERPRSGGASPKDVVPENPAESTAKSDSPRCDERYLRPVHSITIPLTLPCKPGRRSKRLACRLRFCLTSRPDDPISSDGALAESLSLIKKRCLYPLPLALVPWELADQGIVREGVWGFPEPPRKKVRLGMAELGYLGVTATCRQFVALIPVSADDREIRSTLKHVGWPPFFLYLEPESAVLYLRDETRSSAPGTRDPGPSYRRIYAHPQKNPAADFQLVGWSSVTVTVDVNGRFAPLQPDGFDHIPWTQLRFIDEEAAFGAEKLSLQSVT